MSAESVLLTSQSVAKTGTGPIVGANLARLVLLMRAWQRKSVQLEGKNNQETKRNVEDWLGRFNTMFVTGMVDIDVLSGFGGFAVGMNEGIRADLIDKATEINKQVFLSTYIEFLRENRSIELTKANMLTRNLVNVWGKGKSSKFFEAWNRFELEAKGLGLTLNERADAFINTGVGRDFVHLIDSSGRKWTPDRYAAMYSRTRAREIEDITHVATIQDIGFDVVRITNANTTTPICLKYENKYFSLTGKTKGLPILPIRPPFHPNCRHRIRAVSDEVSRQRMIKNNTKFNTRFSDDAQKFTKSQKNTIIKQENWNKENRKPA